MNIISPITAFPLHKKVHTDLNDNSVFDFPVEERSLYWRAKFAMSATEFNEVDASRYTAIVRPDTKAVLGIHGSKYKLRPFADGIDRLNENLEAAGLANEVKIKDNIYDGGARMNRQITFPNLKIKPAINDIVSFRIDLWNSYDGSWAELFNCWAERKQFP